MTNSAEGFSCNLQITSKPYKWKHSFYFLVLLLCTSTETYLCNGCNIHYYVTRETNGLYLYVCRCRLNSLLSSLTHKPTFSFLPNQFYLRPTFTYSVHHPVLYFDICLYVMYFLMYLVKYINPVCVTVSS